MNTPAMIGHVVLSSIGAIASAKGSMRWLFARDDQTIEFTATLDGPGDYVTAIRWPNGGQEMTRFFSIEPMLLHLLTLIRQLRHSEFILTTACFADRKLDWFQQSDCQSPASTQGPRATDESLPRRDKNDRAPVVVPPR